MKRQRLQDSEEFRITALIVLGCIAGSLVVIGATALMRLLS